MARLHGGPGAMARMVDIGEKPDIRRRAVASGAIILAPKTVRAIRARTVAKGDPLATAEVATLQAVKRVWEALPHCHPIPITSAAASFRIDGNRVECTCEVEATYKTGVEMEALYGCTVGLLTVWDMVKSIEKDRRGQYPRTRLVDVRVVSKEKSKAAGRTRGRKRV